MTDTNNAPLKVLMILEDWNSGGGTEAHVSQLCQYLKNHTEIQVYLAILHGGEQTAPTSMSNWTKDIFWIGKRGITALLKLRQIIRHLSPDVCHAHLYTSLLSVTLLLRATKKRGKLVTTLHMPLSHWNWRHRLRWRIAIQLADIVTGVSTEVIRSIGMENKAHVISPPCVSPIKGLLQSKENIFTVSACGRLAREKDWPTLFRAFAQFEKRVDKPVRLIHIGDGPLEPEIKALISALEINDCVNMIGRLPHSEVLSRVATSNVFVLPSRFEGLGMAALEAMQCGVPTITADFGASYDFIENGVTGYQFPRGDWQALSDLLLWHYWHPEQAVEIGKKGNLFVTEKFSMENTFKKYVKVYGSPSL